MCDCDRGRDRQRHQKKRAEGWGSEVDGVIDVASFNDMPHWHHVVLYRLFDVVSFDQLSATGQFDHCLQQNTLMMYVHVGSFVYMYACACLCLCEPLKFNFLIILTLWLTIRSLPHLLPGTLRILSLPIFSNCFKSINLPKLFSLATKNSY